MRGTNEPLALIAQEAGFVDQSHLNSAFRREIGITSGQFRAALASPSKPEGRSDISTVPSDATFRVDR
jgi:AraC-like DNA-binding protein